MIKNYFVYFPSRNTPALPDFEITAGGLNGHPPRKPYPNAGHPQSRMFDFEAGRTMDSFQILWIAQGKGIYRDRRHASLPIQAGQSILLFPGHWHAYRPDLETGWEEHWVEFRGVRPLQWLKDKRIHTSRPILGFSQDPLLPLLFHELHRLNQRSDQGSRELRNSLALHLLQRTIDGAGGKKSRPELPQLRRYRELQEKMGQEIPLTSLHSWCSSQGVSYHTFRVWFQRENGLSPKQYLGQLRLRKAKEWLRGSALQIQEIAEKTGYANAFHFSNDFKKSTGFSPKAFRSGLLK